MARLHLNSSSTRWSIAWFILALAVSACGDDDPQGDPADTGPAGRDGGPQAGTSGRDGGAGDCAEEPSFVTRYTSADENWRAGHVSFETLCKHANCPKSLADAVAQAAKRGGLDAGAGRCGVRRISGCGVTSLLVTNAMPHSLWNFDETGKLIGAGIQHDLLPGEPCGPLLNAGEGRPTCPAETIERLCDTGDDDAGIHDAGF